MPMFRRGTVDLHYSVSGSGRSIVLIHGWCDDLRTWEPLVERLSVDYRCITIDLRGHGHSTIPRDHDFSFEAMSNDVAAICRHERIETALLIGHSYGALVAAATARRHSALAGGLMLMDQNFDIAALQSQLRPIEHVVRGAEQHLAFRVEFLGALIGNIRETYRARLEQAIAKTPTEVAIALWAPLFEWSPEELTGFTDRMLAPLSKLRNRVIDRERLPAYHDDLKRRYPNVHIDYVAGGHWLQLEHTDRIAADVRTLYAELP